MISMAVHPSQRELVGPLLNAVRKSAHLQTPLDLLREILILASVVGDEAFTPDRGEGAMT